MQIYVHKILFLSHRQSAKARTRLRILEYRLLLHLNKSGALQSLISPNAFHFQKSRLIGVCTVCLGHFGRQLASEIFEQTRYVCCFYHSPSKCPVEIGCCLSTVAASHLTGHMSHSDHIQSIASFYVCFCLIRFYTSHQQSFSYKGMGLIGSNQY